LYHLIFIVKIKNIYENLLIWKKLNEPNFISSVN